MLAKIMDVDPYQVTQVSGWPAGMCAQRTNAPSKQQVLADMRMRARRTMVPARRCTLPSPTGSWTW